MIPKGLVPKAGMEYVRRLRDVKYYETIFEILARQFEVAKLDEAKEGAVIQVVDAAVPPDRRSFPQRALIVIGAALAGIFLGVLTVVLEASWQRLRSDPESSAKINQLRWNILGKRRERAKHFE
jgi:uncharacterized protein involved in exopolysaccharide biosynthesis